MKKETEQPMVERPLEGDVVARFGHVKPLCNGRTCAKVLNVSESYLSAVKKGMGLTAKWLDPEAIRAWIVAHPEFRATDVYPVKGGRSEE